MFLVFLPPALAEDPPVASPDPHAELWAAARQIQAEPEIKLRSQLRREEIPAGVSTLPAEGRVCRVDILLDPRGTPIDTQALACDPILYPSAQAVAMRYRFYPLVVEGRRVHAHFWLDVSFAG